MKDWDGQVGSTDRSWVRRIGQIQQYWEPCKPRLHQAWTKPKALSCSAALSNSCSWICDPHSQRCYRKSGAGSTIFLHGSCCRGKESLGCHSRGHFRLGRQENCPENLYYGKILVKILLFHEGVPGGSEWKLFPPGNWKSCLCCHHSLVLCSVRCFSWWQPRVLRSHGAKVCSGHGSPGSWLLPVPLSPCLALPWVRGMPECLPLWACAWQGSVHWATNNAQQSLDFYLPSILKHRKTFSRKQTSGVWDRMHWILPTHAQPLPRTF